MKIIAIQDGLESLKEELANIGYKVVSYGQIDSPVDAYIYYEQDNNQSLSMVNRHLNSIFSSVPAGLQSNRGTLLINANNKTVQDIQEILTNRTYTPLF